MKEFINLNKKFKELDSCINASNEPEQCSIADIVRGQPQKKKVKTTNIKPIAFVRFNTKLGKPKPITIKVLLDSGASESVIREEHCKNLRVKKDSKKTSWATPGGTLTTSKVAKAEFTLPELQDDKLIEWKWHVVKDLGSYDAIIGRDLMQFLGIDILFSDQTVKWGNATMPFKDGDCSTQEAYYVQEPEQLVQASERLKSILDAKYEQADVQDICDEQAQLNDDEKKKLFELLSRYEDLFDGTLGKWTGTEVKLELVEGATPYHARSFPVPRCHMETLKVEVDRLCELGVLKKVNRSQWAAPTFLIPKKDGSVRFISDFRELNKRIKRRPYPIPHIQDLLLNLEGFKYATSLDLNMGYYHLELSDESKELCTIVLLSVCSKQASMRNICFCILDTCC
mgnify:FL=1